MAPHRLLAIGVIGTIVTALCCFTPMLVVIFWAIGLGAAIGYIDIVLLPLLALFICIVLFAFLKLRA